MHHAAAGEVERAGGAEEAAAGPHAVRDGAVDEEEPREEEGDHGAEAHPLREGAADDGCGVHGEAHMENEKDGFWDCWCRWVLGND